MKVGQSKCAGDAHGLDIQSCCVFLKIRVVLRVGDLAEVLMAGGVQVKGDMCPFCGTLQAVGVKAGNGAVCSNCGMDLKVS